MYKYKQEKRGGWAERERRGAKVNVILIIFRCDTGETLYFFHIIFETVIAST